MNAQPPRSLPRRVLGKARRVAKSAALTTRRSVRRYNPFFARRDIRRASAPHFVQAAYQIILRRDPDPDGLANYVDHLEEGRYRPEDVIDEMASSMEYRNHRPHRNTLRALHQGRCDFVQLLPPAQRILDLGGTDQESRAGALVGMGYPHSFDELIIVDLPHEDRHDLYTHSDRIDEVKTDRGLVRYEYHSMVDLSRYADASFDLVFSGQSIEHITEAEGAAMAAEAFRVLRPGGWFCLDTPNRTATRVHVGDEMFTNPDHKLEYTADQLASVLRTAGFDVTGTFGIGHVPESIASDRFDELELATHYGVYGDPEHCYFLAYLARKPSNS